tara:strand:+ start:10274 stop:11335 length:1062 start_codon:yes stop_codon:yes gene_type:complete
MAINLQSIRRAYNAMYNTSGNARVKLATQYMKMIPGGIQQWAKESSKRVEAYKKNSPSLDPFRGYNASELKYVLEWKAEWDSHAKQLAKKNLSDEERAYHTGEQNRIEQALTTYKDETERYNVVRKQVVDNYNNMHPMVTTEDKLMYDNFFRGEYRPDRKVDMNTGSSTWGTQVIGNNEDGQYLSGMEINDIYSINPMPVLLESDKNWQTTSENRVFNRVKSLANNKQVSPDIAKNQLQTLYSSLYDPRRIWAGDYIDTWVGKIKADMLEDFNKFSETTLGKKLNEADKQDFESFKDLLKSPEKIDDVLKNLLKKAGGNIKEDWINFNTTVSMNVFTDLRNVFNVTDPLNPNK